MAGRKKGCAKTGGRKPGSVNRVTASVKQALQEAFSELGGTASLVKWAKKNEGDFYRLWIKMLPKELTVVLEDDKLGKEVRGKLDEVDGGGLGQPGEAGGTQPAVVADPAAPEAHQPQPAGDGGGSA